MKTCRVCLIEKPLDGFHRHHGTRDKRQHFCRDCARERGANYLKDPAALAKRKASTAAYYRRNKEDLQARNKRRFVENRAAHLAWEAKRRATRKKIPYTLTEHDVAELQRAIDAGHCAVTGIPFIYDHRGSFASPSIDRIDSDKGYEPGNVRMVCKIVNMAMGHWGEDILRFVMQSWFANEQRA